ncbi:hypothetical protein BGL34_01365 [Fructilactobacillus lindneri]|uniref:Rqc2 family fibronectin-binding protein n=1 Tax=Fructilactobacillus lindneri TaxID=53444 RepID=UPI000CD3B81A|nr:NFACT RNA binding domain-containing protein [Fructilactobacillus lindneri]POH08247.1 hypothetical protein BGL34_01365 [Fructilactobacillus lindneri]
MSFDGSFMHAMSNELNNELLNGRVTKINEPYPNEIMMTIRANGNNYQTLLSANPLYARIQTTKIPFTNPKEPSNFAMTLRKRLRGSFLNKIHQVDNDRVMHFHFNTRNELGDIEELVLVIEVMARHSNIILVEAKNRNIIDAVKRIGLEKNRYRTLLPGSKYINPPKQNMINPFDLNDFTTINQLNHDFPNVSVFATNLRQYLQGLGKDTSTALATAIHEPGSTIKSKYQNFFSNFNNPTPTISISENGKLNFSAFPYLNQKIEKQFPTLSEMLDVYFQTKVNHERVREQGSQLIQITQNELKKNKRKIKRLEQSEKESKLADEYRIKGEILMTYLKQVKSGEKLIVLPNFYDNNKKIKINLKPSLSPSANAQWYFKQYQKKKNAVKFINQQLKKTKAEIDYFENIKSQIEIADPENLADIKIELQNEGYLKIKNKVKKQRKAKVSKPERFVSDNGTIILVGKNNLQNDQLTHKIADKRDTWLHTQKIHGSHVIIRSFNPSEETIIQAAELAAYYSKARNSANVPVDYDVVKRIKKPSGAKPGFVTYTGQKTVYVTPNKEKFKHLRENVLKNN